MARNTYVLITPARNEASFIELTLKSVISQSILPKKWVIINDGSTDHTEEIVQRYAVKQDFIHLITLRRTGQRDFGSKVDAFKLGYRELRNIEYDFIGNLDADVSFERNYYESLMEKFMENPKLGIAGGMILEFYGGRFREIRYSLKSVGGAVQFFRRKCYEDIGGYIPLKKGGVDAVVEVMARVQGWEVQSFPEIKVYHHRNIGFSKGGRFSRLFRYGELNYSIGCHPLFYTAKCFAKAKETPYLIGGLIMLCGYFWSYCRKDVREVPEEFIRYIRREQMNRLRSAFTNFGRNNRIA